MAKDNSKDPAIPQPQQIPLSKIQNLPGVFVDKQPDKSYGGLVTGYRRRRASELAKKQDTPRWCTKCLSRRPRNIITR